MSKNRVKKLSILLLSASVIAGVSVSRNTSADGDKFSENAFTNSPVSALGETVRHKMIPMYESDEAYLAAKHKTFSRDAFNKLAAGSSDDYFKDMDYGITLPENQDDLVKTLNPYIPGISKSEAARRAARGRNNWIVFTGGNDRFWNYMTRATFGSLDFLKTLSDWDQLPSTRDNRWEELGLVNEPCFEKAQGPRDDRFGLWLPKRSSNCAADPFENENNFPGVKEGARGTMVTYQGKPTELPVGSSYGYATGVIGFRLFPNPDFDQAAAAKWDSKRFYTDASYFSDPNLVRPYRVGMACALCHVGPNPSRPPSDFDHPAFSNLNSNPGAQYFWVDRIFTWDYKNNQNSFIYQLLHTSRPGTLDTSIVSSDQINNPRTMNAVYDMASRVQLTAKMGNWEQLTGDEALNNQFNFLDQGLLANSSPLRSLFDIGKGVMSPRVLKDGSDSVGVLGALNRVYLNIGLFSEEWVQNFIPLVGGPDITPMKIATLNKKSLYWKANVTQTPDLALFMIAATRPDKLEAAPGGPGYLKAADSPELETGKKVFATNCAGCHSSKLPEKAFSFFNKGTACNGSGYMNCWNQYYTYIQSDEFKQAMLKMVEDPDFLKDNYLSTDLRVPANLLDTQLCSPLATNAIKGDVWDNFSSTGYKQLPSVGNFRVNYLDSNLQSKSEVIVVPGGGRGYTRPPSLISVWSTAPFLINNSLGKFDRRGTVDGRLASFDDSIDKLLNPMHRGHPTTSDKLAMTYKTGFDDELPGTVDVLSEPSYLRVPKGYLPRGIADMVQAGMNRFDKEHAESYIKKGPVYAKVETWRKEPDPSWFERAFAAIQFWKKSETADRKVASVDDQNSANYADNELANTIMLGPIPAGVPIDLISNIDLKSNPIHQAEAIAHLVEGVVASHNLKGEDATRAFMNKAGDALIKVSKCSDFVVDRGHYFGSEYSPMVKNGSAQALTASEKSALTDYMKHF